MSDDTMTDVNNATDPLAAGPEMVGEADDAPVTPEYEAFRRLVMARHSARLFTDKPIPKGYLEKIVECGRWAMSGANSQPWEFIIVQDKEKIRKLYESYRDTMHDLNFWLEQRFKFEFRHPGFRLEGTPEEQYQQIMARKGWSEAPALIVVLGDGRRQLGSVSGANTWGREQSHFMDALANASTHIHLAAASLGLATQWVSMHIQEPTKKILNVPDVLRLFIIIPVGYPAKPLTGIFRRKLRDIVHYEEYDHAKLMSNEEIIQYLFKLRRGTIRTYVRSRGEQHVPWGDPAGSDKKD